MQRLLKREVVRMATLPRRRWKEAFRCVRAIERRSPVLPDRFPRRRWSLHRNIAVHADVQVRRLPRYLRPKGPAGDHLSAPASADLVRIGKFDIDRQVRLRAFYIDARQSVRFQAGGPHDGVRRSLFAYRYLSKYAPELSPRVLDHGTVRRAPYLVEEISRGRHPRGAEQLEATIAALTAGLSAVHAGAGVRDQPLLEVLGEGFAARLRNVIAVEHVDPAVDRVVEELLGRAGTVPVSLGHGDLVASNILINSDAVTLIDWEYAGWMPVLFDVAKVHLHCTDPGRAADLLEEGLRPTLRRGSRDYSAREQLALAHLRFLSWDVKRRRRAVAAGRLSQFEDMTRQRWRTVAQLLDLAR